MKKLILICMATIALSSCASEPTMFGMPEAKFKALPAKQQEMVIKSYNDQQKIRTENEPTMAAVNAASSLGQTAILTKSIN